MRYLAILGYGCGHEANYGFIKEIRFSAKDNNGLGKKVHKLNGRVPQKRNGFQCKKSFPVEVFIFDESFKLVERWDRNQEREV